MKAFILAGELYIRCVPGKNLFHSTMVHEVVNRGDVFAIRCRDQALTIISGKSDVEHVNIETYYSEPAQIKKPTEIKKPTKTVAAMRARLKQMEILL